MLNVDGLPVRRSVTLLREYGYRCMGEECMEVGARGKEGCSFKTGIGKNGRLLGSVWR